MSKYSRVSRQVLKEELLVPTAERGSHTIWAPAGYRVVSGGYAAQEEGDPDDVHVFASFPVHEPTGATAWRFWYTTSDTNVSLAFFVIVEAIYPADEQISLNA